MASAALCFRGHAPSVVLPAHLGICTLLRSLWYCLLTLAYAHYCAACGTACSPWHMHIIAQPVVLPAHLGICTLLHSLWYCLLTLAYAHYCTACGTACSPWHMHNIAQPAITCAATRSRHAQLGHVWPAVHLWHVRRCRAAATTATACTRHTHTHTHKHCWRACISAAISSTPTSAMPRLPLPLYAPAMHSHTHKRIPCRLACVSAAISGTPASAAPQLALPLHAPDMHSHTCTHACRSCCAVTAPGPCAPAAGHRRFLPPRLVLPRGRRPAHAGVRMLGRGRAPVGRLHGECACAPRRADLCPGIVAPMQQAPPPQAGAPSAYDASLLFTARAPQHCCWACVEWPGQLPGLGSVQQVAPLYAGMHVRVREHTPPQRHASVPGHRAACAFAFLEKRN